MVDNSIDNTIYNNTPTIDLGGDDAALPSNATPTVGQINLTDTSTPNNLTLEGTEQRAAMAHYALQDKSPGVANLNTVITNGGEPALRDSAAWDQTIQNNKMAFNIIGQLAGRKGGPLNDDEQNAVFSIVASSQPDPNTILEKMWANNYTKELLSTPSGPMKDGLLHDPGKTLAIAGHTDQLIAKRQIALSLKQEIDKKYEDAPWFDNTQPSKAQAWLLSSTLDLGKLRLRNAVPGSEDYSNSILPGQNLTDLRDFMFLLPVDKFAQTAKATVNDLYRKNPHLAQKFVDSLVNRPDDAAWVDDTMAVADAAALIPGGLVARGTKAFTQAVGKVATKAPVAVSEEFAEAGKNIFFTPKQIEELKEKGKLIPKLSEQAQDDLTVKVPRGMAPIELRKAADAFPEEVRYPSSLNTQNSPVTLPESLRGTSQNEVVSYKVGDREFKPTKNTVYVDPEVLDRTMQATGENPKRLFKNSDGNLELTQRTDAGWSRTGETIPHSTTPEVGRVALDLGPESKSMGSSYYDQFRAGGRVTEVQNRANEVTTPSMMGVRDIDRAREGLPSQMLSPQLDLTARREATVKVNAAQTAYDDARRVLDTTGGANAQKEVLAAKQRLDDAVSARANTSFYTNNPVIDRAQQGIRSYMSAAVRALKEVPMATGTGVKADLQGSLSTLGRIDDAVETGTMRNVLDRIQSQDDPVKQAEGLGKDLVSLLRPNPTIENSSALSREGVTRLSQGLMENSTKLQEALSGMRVQRLTQEDLKTAFDSSKDDILNKYSTNFQNSVMDMKHEYHPDTNTYHIDTTLGKTKAVGFDSEYSARNTALMDYKIPLGDFSIKQEGGSYFIHVDTPIRETEGFSSMINNTFIPTNNKTPMSMTNILLRFVRSAEDTTSELQRAARHVATHAPQELKAVIMSVAKDIRLSKTEAGELRTLLEQSRTEFDTQGRMGKWYDINELEQSYQNRFSKLPSEDFTNAYYTFKQLHDFDYLLRANQLYAMKTRWGVQNVTFKQFVDGEAKDAANFEGRRVDDFDLSQSRDRGILVVDSDSKTQTLRWTNSDYKNDPDFKKYIDDLTLNRGYEIIQLFSPLKKPLKETNGGDIYFVVTNTAEKRNIQIGEGLEYREGTHVVYTHPHFVKQPIVTMDGKGQPVYAGDHTFRSGGSSEAEGRAWALKYDNARRIMNSGDDVALETYLSKNLPESIGDFKKAFTGPNALDKDMPIVYTYSGQNAFQTNPELIDQFGKLKQYANDFSNPEMTINSKYMQDRADQPLMVAKDLGVDIPDRFRLDTAPMLDPYITLNRAMGQAVRSRFMDDYKVLAAESFIKEFGKYIPNVSEEALARNPMHFLYAGTVDRGTDLTTQAAFKQFQTNVQNFVGMQSEVGQAISYFEGKMQNSLYRTLGSETTTKFLENDTVQSLLIPAIKDPFKFTRSIAFHNRLGFFNPVQLWVQSQTLANVIAIAPGSGMNGFAVSAYLRAGGRYALDNPALADRYVNMIAKTTTWDKADIREALEAYKDSGVSRVGGETAWRDDFFDPKLFQGKLGTFLDKGTVFFQAGERLVRDTAFFTAFHEWRKLNPGAILDQYAKGEIMNRFDTLSLNMTRASNSSFQNGAFSIPTQFMTFNQRQMEQFLGGRLSMGEKARVMGMYSSLYGIPVALSSVTGMGIIPGITATTGLPNPNYDDIRTYMLEKNVDVHSDYFKAMHEGILSLGFSKLTGKETDLPTRWGPGSSQIGKDLINLWTGTDQNAKTAGELIFGPSGSIVKDSVKAMWPFWKWAAGSVTGEDYPIKLEDFAGLGNELATFSGAEKFAIAYAVNKYYSKKGQYIGDVSTFDGFLMGTLGLTPRQFQDDFLKQTSLNVAKNVQNKMATFMKVEYQRGTEEAAKGNMESATAHFKRADVMAKSADMRWDVQGKTFMQSAKGFESLHDQLNQSWLFQDPRASMQSNRLKELQGNQ